MENIRWKRPKGRGKLVIRLELNMDLLESSI